jgi:hypothetical protein
LQVLQKQALGKRDDIESLIWTLLRLYLGELPWETGGKITLAAMEKNKLRVREKGVKSEPACKHMVRLISHYLTVRYSISGTDRANVQEGYLAKCFDGMLALSY